jgi:hypothetical protein
MAAAVEFSGSGRAAPQPCWWKRMLAGCTHRHGAGLKHLVCSRAMCVLTFGMNMGAASSKNCTRVD